ncbi:MAG TPA: hypothetical protein VM243_01440, partial [Phycisphaerae bacterium]|nr:hypothetical protein [Phycisphaerae bacterium]
MLVFVIGLLARPATGQEPRIDPEKPTALTHAGLIGGEVAVVAAPAVDLQVVQPEDQQRQDEGLPFRFAIPNPVRITPDTGGTWERLNNEVMLWRLRISSPGALSLNLGFTRYFMPPGGRLFVYSADLSYVVRPFTDRDNEEHGQLWTPVVLSDEIVVEVTIPGSVIEQLDLELGSINVGYRGFGETGGDRSGSCNVDVICPEGDGWRNEIKTVGVISTGGSTNCTGFMVNNTSEDLTPFFMTAQHCGVSSSNAASLVVYWNYENSYCRAPGSPESGQPGDGSLSQFQTGSYWRASNGSSDFTLVEMDDDPDPLWDVGYAGWDHSSNDSTSAVAVHHPNCDEKRISFENDPTATSSYLGTTSPGDGTHVWVDDWDLGTTEPGSSGSPLFDQNHRAIGQLHGGYAACGNDDSDWYGRFSVSWTGGGTSTTRLSDWLDSAGTGAMTTDFISLATQCTDAGEPEMLSPKYACESVVGIRVTDCGPNVDPGALDTITVTIQSNSEVSGETVLLTETSLDVGKFEGTIQISETDAPGVVFVADGDKLTVTYVDADDGQGGTNIEVFATADVDCVPPIISNVQTINIEARNATVTFDADEPALGTVWYGLSCGSWLGSAVGSDYSTSGVVDLANLQDETTYFYALDAEDEAGNATTDDNGGNCYAFTTPQVPDFYTEEFVSDNDLDNISLFFTPNASVDFYDGCA